MHFISFLPRRHENLPKSMLLLRKLLTEANKSIEVEATALVNKRSPARRVLGLFQKQHVHRN